MKEEAFQEPQDKLMQAYFPKKVESKFQNAVR